MENLSKFSIDYLQTKSKLELRQILRKKFQYVKGTASMEQEELVELVTQLKEEKQKEIDQSINVNQDVIYKDVPGNEWKINKVENGEIHIYNAQNFTTRILATAFEHTFQETTETEFSGKSAVPTPKPKSKPAVTPTNGSTDDDEKKEEEPNKKESAKLSKSDLVRKIIRRQHRANEKVTSGTVMKELKDKYDLDIHRSFCSTILRSYKKILNDE